MCHSCPLSRFHSLPLRTIRFSLVFLSLSLSLSLKFVFLSPPSHFFSILSRIFIPIALLFLSVHSIWTAVDFGPQFPLISWFFPSFFFFFFPFFVSNSLILKLSGSWFSSRRFVLIEYRGWKLSDCSGFQLGIGFVMFWIPSLIWLRAPLNRQRIGSFARMLRSSMSIWSA